MSAARFLDILLCISLNAGVVVLLVWAAQAIFRGVLSPRFRTVIWAALFVRLLFPIPSKGFLSFPICLQFEPFPKAAEVVPKGQEQPKVYPAALSLEAAPLPGKAPFVEAARSLSAPILALVLWLGGVAVLATHLTWSSARTHRRFRSARLVDDPELLAALLECQSRLGTRRKLALMESPAVSTPLLCGLFRPRLLLPVGLKDRLSAKQVRFVFLHELAHLKQHDLGLGWVAACLQILHWFNPFVWFGFSRWRIDRELSCDFLAIEAAGFEHRGDYGQTVLRLLEFAQFTALCPAAIGILESRRGLRQRIKAIAGSRPERWGGLWVANAACVLASQVVVGAPVYYLPSATPMQKTIVPSRAIAIFQSSTGSDDFRFKQRPLLRYGVVDPGYVIEPIRPPLEVPPGYFDISVAGEVRKPGRYALPSTATLLDAIRAAGGFTTSARRSGIRVDRATTMQLTVDCSDPFAQEANYGASLRLIDLDHIYVPARTMQDELREYKTIPIRDYPEWGG